MYAVVAIVDTNLSTRFIDQALHSGEFLVFDPKEGRFENSLVNERLFQLRDRINRLRNSAEDFRELINKFIIKYKDIVKQEGDVTIPNEELLYPMVLADREQDIVRLTVGLLRAFDEDDSYLRDIQLNATTPLIEEAEQIEEETPTLEEITEWVKGELKL
jgi:Mg2+ and Co2+ transporter CorA